jgi:hypothetical protein
MGAHEQLSHRDSTTNLKAGLGVGRAGQDLLEYGPTRSDCLEALVSLARCPIRDGRRHQTQRIEPQPAGRHECGQYVGQFVLEDDASTRL